MDLKNIGGGKKLIQEIIRNNTSKNEPWTKSEQYKQLQNQKNTLNRQVTSTNKNR